MLQINLQTSNGVDHTFRAQLCSIRGVATFFDVETFSTIQEVFFTPNDLPHYDPNQIFNSLRDGGISKRNFLVNSRGTRERELCATLAQRGEKGSLGLATHYGMVAWTCGTLLERVWTSNKAHVLPYLQFSISPLTNCIRRLSLLLISNYSFLISIEDSLPLIRTFFFQ